jgi:hypothetical protein
MRFAGWALVTPPSPTNSSARLRLVTAGSRPLQRARPADLRIPIVSDRPCSVFVAASRRLPRFPPRSGRNGRYETVRSGTAKCPKPLWHKGERHQAGPGRYEPLRPHNPKVTGSNPAPATIETLANSGPPDPQLLFQDARRARRLARAPRDAHASGFDNDARDPAGATGPRARPG